MVEVRTPKIWPLTSTQAPWQMFVCVSMHKETYIHTQSKKKKRNIEKERKKKDNCTITSNGYSLPKGMWHITKKTIIFLKNCTPGILTRHTQIAINTEKP